MKKISRWQRFVLFVRTLFSPAYGLATLLPSLDTSLPVASFEKGGEG